VYELQCLGVEGVAGHYGKTILNKLFVFGECGAAKYAVAAVDFIVEKRMVLTRKMDADLMGAASFEFALNQRYVSKSLQNSVMCYRVFANAAVWRIDAHHQSVFGTAGDVADDSAGWLFDVAPDKRVVASVDGMVKKLLCQMHF
jgi:hypothetical protein